MISKYIHVFRGKSLQTDLIGEENLGDMELIPGDTVQGGRLGVRNGLGSRRSRDVINFFWSKISGDFANKLHNAMWKRVLLGWIDVQKNCPKSMFKPKIIRSDVITEWNGLLTTSRVQLGLCRGVSIGRRGVWTRLSRQSG